MGWAIVALDYRLGDVSLAPAAVEDCRCGVRWVIDDAQQYNFDTSKIVLSGESAGGHLALITGMLPVSAGLDRECAGTEPIRVAAIVNLCGITDVADLLEGANYRPWAVQWFGSQPDREALAPRISPIDNVRPGLPPIITLQGDAVPPFLTAKLSACIRHSRNPECQTSSSQCQRVDIAHILMGQWVQGYDKFLANTGAAQQAIVPPEKK
jgi:acetyl esterase/lipase